MVELAILSALAVPSFVLAYIGFKLKDEHSSMKLLMVAFSQVFLLGVPFTGWKLAESAGYNEIASYMLGFELAAVIVFVVFTFYSIYLYLRAAALVTSGTKNSFEEDEI